MSISLASLKEQLEVLGHRLPDEQILSILRDMNVDVDAPPNLPTHPPASAWSVPTAPSQTWGAHPSLPPVCEEDDLCITHLPSDPSAADIDFQRACTQPLSALPPQYHAAGPALDSSKACSGHEWYGQLQPDVLPSLDQSHDKAAASNRSSLQHQGKASPAEKDRDTAIARDSKAAAPVQQGGAEGRWVPLAAHHSTIQGKVQVESEGEASDDGVDDILQRYFHAAPRQAPPPTNGGPQRGTMLQQLDTQGAVGMQAAAPRPPPPMPRQRPHNFSSAPANEAVHHRPASAAASSNSQGPPGHSSLLQLLAAEQGTRIGPPFRPARYQWHEELRSEAASRAPPSVASARSSVRGSSIGGSSGQAGGGKVDRVARYKQLQQAWSSDSFLKSTPSATRSSGTKSAAVATSRKPLNFHSYFKVLHAAEAAEQAMLLKLSRNKTQDDLATPSIGPHEKRRDGIRYQMRQQMRQA